MTDKNNFRGLDLANVDVTTREEVAAFRSATLEAKAGKLMYPVSAYSFLLENRPDMMKLHFRQLNGLQSIPGEGDFPVLMNAAMLHWYTINRYQEGIDHEIRASQAQGVTKDQINEILAIAYTHSGPSGFRFVYHAAFDYLATYQEPSHEPVWPSGWAPEPDAMKSGIDLSPAAWTKADEEALFGWYERTIGEVPSSVVFMARHNPEFLKAYRAKLERAMRGAIPKQLLPYMFIHFNMNRGFGDGVREATLLGRAWGMTKGQVILAISSGAGYMAGLDSVYIVEEAVGDILDDWETSV